MSKLIKSPGDLASRVAAYESRVFVVNGTECVDVSTRMSFALVVWISLKKSLHLISVVQGRRRVGNPTP